MAEERNKMNERLDNVAAKTWQVRNQEMHDLVRKAARGVSIIGKNEITDEIMKTILEHLQSQIDSIKKYPDASANPVVLGRFFETFVMGVKFGLSATIKTDDRELNILHLALSLGPRYVSSAYNIKRALFDSKEQAEAEEIWNALANASGCVSITEKPISPFKMAALLKREDSDYINELFKNLKDTPGNHNEEGAPLFVKGAFTRGFYGRIQVEDGEFIINEPGANLARTPQSSS